MDSGIYQITFPSGYFYLGKSETVGQRWKTHQKNFEQGTHTKKMQAAYDAYGQPDYEIILPVHPEHIGIYESIFINNAWNNKILNTTKPRKLDTQEATQYLDVYDNITIGGESCMLFSTLEHVNIVKSQFQELESANLRVEALEHRGFVLPEEAKEAMEDLRDMCLKQNTELQRLNKLSWFDRVFNYRVYV